MLDIGRPPASSSHGAAESARHDGVLVVRKVIAKPMLLAKQAVRSAAAGQLCSTEHKPFR
jgi:hypothetical protein